MAMAKYNYSVADVNDIVQLMRLLDIANNYSVQRSGSKQWQNMEHVKKQFIEHIVKNECLKVVNNKEEIVASASFSDKDTYIWGLRGSDNKSLYAHKMMKNPLLAPPEVSKRLFNVIANKALILNKQYVRCDTRSELQGLIGYYKRLGFLEAGTFVYKSTGANGQLLQIDSNLLLKNTL
jgi:hypothetical protein